MGVNYLWDTNVVLYYLQQQFSANAEQFIDALLKDSIPIISAITEIELLCWKSATEEDLTLLHQFIKDSIVIDLTSEIKIKTVVVRKMHHIKLPDSVIAATALVHDLTLLSRNTADFKKIKELKLVNPWDL